MRWLPQLAKWAFLAKSFFMLLKKNLKRLLAKSLTGFRSLSLTETEQQELTTLVSIREEQIRVNPPSPFQSQGFVLGGVRDDISRTLEERRRFLNERRLARIHNTIVVEGVPVPEGDANSADSTTADLSSRQTERVAPREMNGDFVNTNETPLFQSYGHFFRRDSFRRPTVIRLDDSEAQSLIQEASIPSTGRSVVSSVVTRSQGNNIARLQQEVSEAIRNLQNVSPERLEFFRAQTRFVLDLTQVPRIMGIEP